MTNVKRIITKKPARTPQPPKKYVYQLEMAAVADFSFHGKPIYQDWTIGIFTSIEKANDAREAYIQKKYNEYERLDNDQWHNYLVDGYPKCVTLRKSSLYQPTYFNIYKLELD